MMPNSTDIMYLDLYNTQYGNFAGYGCNIRERLNIYLKAGEKINFGMHTISTANADYTTNCYL